MNRFAGTDQRIYLKVEGHTVQGFIKVGIKDLFFREPSGKCREISPLCVLDFYVHESMQRQGLGKALFVKMLNSENVLPSKLAYDRPSPKLIKFLQKHFSLVHYVPQNNNYVIFDEYFKGPGKEQPKEPNQRSPQYGRGLSMPGKEIECTSLPMTRHHHDPRQADRYQRSPQYATESKFRSGEENGQFKNKLNATVGQSDELNKFQNSANTLLQFQGHYRDVYQQRGNQTVNPKFEKRIEELE